MIIYTIEDIAKELHKNPLVVRHWVKWNESEEKSWLPEPIKIIGVKRKVRIYDTAGLNHFRNFATLLKNNPGIMAEYNKKHFWKKK